MSSKPATGCGSMAMPAPCWCTSAASDSRAQAREALAGRLAARTGSVLAWRQAVGFNRCLGGECAQALGRAHIGGRVLVRQRAGVGQAGDLVVRARPPFVLVTDVAFADIAGHDQDLLRRME